MRTRLTKLSLRLALCLTAAALAAQTGYAQNPITDQLRAEWESSCKKMVAIADAMPEDKFDYRPVPEVRSFGEIVAHFAAENMTWMEEINGESKAESWGEFEKLNQRFDGLKTKSEVLKVLKDSNDYGTKVLANLDDKKAMASVAYLGIEAPRWTVVEGTIGHTKEHYGNLVTYLRLNHIVPPASRQ